MPAATQRRPGRTRASGANFGIRRTARAPVKTVLVETGAEASSSRRSQFDRTGIANSYEYLFMFDMRQLFVGSVLASSAMAIASQSVPAHAIVIANASIVDPAAPHRVRKANNRRP